MNAADSGRATAHEQKPFEGRSAFFCGMAPRAQKEGRKDVSDPGSQRRRAGFCVGLQGGKGREHPAVSASQPPCCWSAGQCGNGRMGSASHPGRVVVAWLAEPGVQLVVT